ncbi:MAG TPA: hypothetical protein PLZ52_11545 [Bacteroidales bacterium]|nr:hypothetical protein [Bacteroidales bacterium]
MKTTLRIAVLLVIIAFGPRAFSQSFTGNWDGVLTVDLADGSTGDIGFKMVIIDNGDGTCYGRSQIYMNWDGEAIQAQYDFTGTISGSNLKFSDTDLVEATYPEDEDYYWCKKTGSLYLSGSWLSGKVTGYSPYGDCMPAVAKLEYDSAIE